MSKTGTHGGRRANAGRPNLSGRQNHMERPRITSGDTAHLCLKIQEDLPDLRRKKSLRLFYRAIGKSYKFDWTVLDYALKADEIHFLVKAATTAKLSRSVQSFSICLAKSLNQLFHRQGSVFHGRYRLRLLRSQQEIRRLRRKLKSLLKTGRLAGLINSLFGQMIRQNENIAIQIKAFGVF